MRCDIAASLLHSPSILFLDEPTIGLDASSKLALRDFIKTLNREQGVTVILATHDMHDIEALAERVLIIGNGRVLRDGPIAAMRAETFGERRLIVDFAEDVGDIDIEGVRCLPNGSQSGVCFRSAGDDGTHADRPHNGGSSHRRSVHRGAHDRGADRQVLLLPRRRGGLRESAMLATLVRPYLAIFAARF